MTNFFLRHWVTLTIDLAFRSAIAERNLNLNAKVRT